MVIQPAHQDGDQGARACAAAAHRGLPPGTADPGATGALAGSAPRMAGYATERVFRFPNGARLRLGYCDGQNDVYQYQGQEYDVIGLEEATHFTEEDWKAELALHDEHFDKLAYHLPQELVATKAQMEARILGRRQVCNRETGAAARGGGCSIRVPLKAPTPTINSCFKSLSNRQGIPSILLIRQGNVF